MLSVAENRFELLRVTPSEWIIVDLSCDEGDPERTVACVYTLDEFECDVVWLRDLNLPVAYMTPADVLEDVVRASRPPHRAVRRPRALRPLAGVQDAAHARPAPRT